MTASEEAKALGFKSLTQVADLFGVTLQCLRNYYKYDHDKFMIVLHGCLWIVEHRKDNEKKIT